MNFTPIKERIVIRVPQLEEKTLESGLILRKEDQEKPQTGEVLAIGPEVKEIQVGNTVLYGKHDGVPQVIEGEDVLIMKESQIWGLVNV